MTDAPIQAGTFPRACDRGKSAMDTKGRHSIHLRHCHSRRSALERGHRRHDQADIQQYLDAGAPRQGEAVRNSGDSRSPIPGLLFPTADTTRRIRLLQLSYRGLLHTRSLQREQVYGVFLD